MKKSLDSKWWIFVHSYCVCKTLSAAFFWLMTRINIPDVFISEFPAEINFLSFVPQPAELRLHAYKRSAWFIAEQNMDERTGTRRYSSLCFYLLDGAVCGFWTGGKAPGPSVMSSVPRNKLKLTRLLVPLSILRHSWELVGNFHKAYLAVKRLDVLHSDTFPRVIIVNSCKLGSKHVTQIKIRVEIISFSLLWLIFKCNG